MKKLAFTLAEIVVAIVVMAVVASVVVPITRDKFEKTDYASYYLAYKAVQNFNVILQQGLKNGGGGNSGSSSEDNEEEGASGLCDLSSGGCFLTPVSSKTLGYLTIAECEEVKDALGISICPTNADYWAAMVKHCGGVQYLPTYEETEKMLSFLYGFESTTDVSGSGGGNNGWVNDGTLNRDHAAILGIPSDAYPVIVNSKVSATDEGASYPSCVDSNVIWWNYGRDCCSSTNFFAFCKTPAGLAGIKDPTETDEGDEEEDSSGDGSSTDGSTTVGVTTTAGFCENLFANFNLPENLKNCDVANADVNQAATNKDFSNLTPHIILPNGLKIYIASDYAEITQLNDSVDEADRIGFVIYIDVDGNRSKSRLYDDVFPFYLTKSGKVIPGYDSSTVAGANCEKNLAFDVLYDEYSTTGSRKLKRLDGIASGSSDDVHSFLSTACLSGYVKSTKYCGFDYSTVTINGINCHTNTNVDCRMKVIKPLRIFN